MFICAHRVVCVDPIDAEKIIRQGLQSDLRSLQRKVEKLILARDSELQALRREASVIEDVKRAQLEKSSSSASSAAPMDPLAQFAASKKQKVNEPDDDDAVV